jgi:ribosomal-protein-serine acetyltransferase
MSEVLPVRDLLAGPLVVRRYRLQDAAALVEAVTASVEHLRPWMPWIALEPQTVEQRRDFISETIAKWEAGSDMTCGMFLAESGELVGGTGLHRRRGPGVLEIGYWTHAGYLGRGYATEASRALTSAALSLDGIKAVEIHHDKANARSRRVPEKLGYELVAETPDEVTASGEAGIDLTWRMPKERWAGTPVWSS